MFYLLLTFVLFQDPTWNVDKNGVAIYGYDPVSYFQQKPQQGKAELAYQYNEAVFYFTSPGNLQIFQSDPEPYLPQYGGFCAYAMGATGDKVKVNPETFKLSDGKLFLFYNKGGNNTLESWNRDEMRLRENADGNWHQ